MYGNAYYGGAYYGGVLGAQPFPKSWPDQIVAQVWSKGTVVPGYDPGLHRKDICGALLAWRDYGNRKSDYGWEVDHIQAVANGGSNVLSNLRPLHWKNNAAKKDGKLVCVVGDL